jgi:hypothetical protein
MAEFVSTLFRGREVQLHWQPEPDRINEYMEQGFIPIELAAGGTSHVDFRCLDHHNEWSHLPSACVTALRYYGGAASSAGPFRFMVNHTDADCVLTGITLMGALPRNLLERLCPEVGALDTDPLGVDFSRLAYGSRILLWKKGMTSVKQSAWSWFYGAQLCVDLFDDYIYHEYYKESAAALEEAEQERKRTALEDYEKAQVSPSGKILLVAPSRAWGFDCQFRRQSGFPVHSRRGWRHWCIAAHLEKTGAVVLSCPNREVAEQVFGPGGLLNVYPRLPALGGKSWGGREAVGGSPRERAFPVHLLNDVLAVLEDSRSEE